MARFNWSRTAVDDRVRRWGIVSVDVDDDAPSKQRHERSYQHCAWRTDPSPSSMAATQEKRLRAINELSQEIAQRERDLKAMERGLARQRARLAARRKDLKKLLRSPL